MKKNFWVIIAAISAVALAAVISVATMLDKDYLEPLSYDHIDDTVYNGIEIIGKDGLFYLVKNRRQLLSREKILAEVDRYCMPQIRSTVDLKIASLGDDSILYGDLAMIKGL